MYHVFAARLFLETRERSKMQKIMFSCETGGHVVSLAENGRAIRCGNSVLAAKRGNRCPFKTHLGLEVS